MRLTWHEAIVKNDRLIIRWPAEEKRLRTLIFVPIFALIAGTALFFIRLSGTPGMGQELSLGGAVLATFVFLWGCFMIWFSKLWVLDKSSNSLLQGGWRKVASLDEFEQFIVKREKRGRAVVFVMQAVRADDSRMELGVMDQEDAHELGRELARFTRLPYSSR